MNILSGDRIGDPQQVVPGSCSGGVKVKGVESKSFPTSGFPTVTKIEAKLLWLRRGMSESNERLGVLEFSCFGGNFQIWYSISSSLLEI